MSSMLVAGFLSLAGADMAGSLTTTSGSMYSSISANRGRLSVVSSSCSREDDVTWMEPIDVAEDRDEGAVVTLALADMKKTS